MRLPIVFLLALTPVLADEASKRARIEEMLSITNAESMTNQMLEQVRGMAFQNSGPTDASAKQLQNRIFDLLKQELAWAKMKPEYVKLYDELFTEEELDAIVAFYRSPAGQAMTKKMPQLVQRSMQLSQRRMNDVMPKVKQLLEEAGATNGAPAK